MEKIGINLTPMNTTPNKKTTEEKCVRCGISKSEWNGRWQKPVCKVGGTSYELHTLSETATPNNRIEEVADKYAYDRPKSGAEATEKRNALISDIESLLKDHEEAVRGEIECNEKYHKIYCELCGFQSVLVEPPRLDATGTKVYGDIMCKKCHLVIGTISYDMSAESLQELQDKQ